MTCAKKKKKKDYREKEVQVKGHISLLPEFCHDSFPQADTDLITSAFPFVSLPGHG